MSTDLESTGEQSPQAAVGTDYDAEDSAVSPDLEPAVAHFQQRAAETDRRHSLAIVPVKERRKTQRRAPLVSGDAFEEFSSVAFGVALRVTGNRQDADDATEELFFALWRKPGDETPETHHSIRARLADALEGKGRPSSSPAQKYEFAGWLPRGVPAPQTAASATGKPTVSVVIPTMNEAKNLPHVFERLPKWIHEVIIVDGHSTDDTRAVAKALRPDVRIIEQDGRGKGNALACGFRAATGDITVMLDADGSTDPAEIPLFVAALTNGHDFAKGTRFVTGGGSDDITFLRKVGNWFLTTVVNRIWGVKYSDLCYGYNAFWTKKLPPSFSDCSGFEVETLMNIRLAGSDIKVVEVPSFEANRRSGSSNLKVGRDGTRIMRTILAEWLRPN